MIFLEQFEHVLNNLKRAQDSMKTIDTVIAPNPHSYEQQIRLASISLDAAIKCMNQAESIMEES